ncbi:oxygen-independent coproporphyrinogen III oxidase [Paracandidimonas soli]|uniref:oxygen-independent coproporphyrinogen III oxidase n=1 Tax=Paracandidimonas soli TaxID=1917182 RepID=UPI0033419B9C
MNIISSDIQISEALVRRYDKSGPRYTSYPTADRFLDGFDEVEYIHYLQQRASDPGSPPLSIYIHLPFCQSLCYFCACNKIITQDHSRSAEYIRYLRREVELLAPHLGEKRTVSQLHLGGGSPTFLNAAELDELMRLLHEYFDFSDDAEFGIEIDPRTVDGPIMHRLAGLGFNRTSFGVQDFDPQVQLAVNRIQPVKMVETTLQASRDAGFRSINMDLIYGLPKQTLASFDVTLDHVVRLSPDRIALYNYAHLPSRFKAQRLISAADLPSAEERLQIFLHAMQRLLDAGYIYIGLDHFARPDDELNRARLDYSLHRNFQGYTTRAECDLVGLGVSAIGKVGRSYSQSTRSLKSYYAHLDAGRLPIEKGFGLSSDDVLRADVIMTVMCSNPIDFDSFNRRYDIDFKTYFSKELSELEPFREGGLLEADDQGIRILPTGRLFVRAMGMVFDRYIGQPTGSTYSRLI